MDHYGIGTAMLGMVNELDELKAAAPQPAIKGEVLQQALDAMATCQVDGYRDVDGDWVERKRFDSVLILEAENSIKAALAAMPTATPSPT
ncbi:MAG: hypothetical protein ABI893_00575 [Polaromonas sp.]